MQLGGPGEKAIPKATMDDARKACQKIMEASSRRRCRRRRSPRRASGPLKMARCMRENGFDFPDPQFGTGGEIRQKIERGSGIDPEDPRFQQAMQACGKHAGFRGGPALSTRGG